MGSKQDLAAVLKVRPNTGLRESMFHLSGDAVICCGEDPGEVQRIIDELFPVSPILHSCYRCYHAWKLDDFTLFLGGIGTGSMEPLMYELLDRKKLGDRTPRRLVMIGTAGHIGGGVDLGQVYIVEATYPVGCGVTLEDNNLPLQPNFAGLDRLNLRRVVSITTDYYYGCTNANDDPRKLHARNMDPRLRRGVAAHWRNGRLINMEDAPFYHFAKEKVYGEPGTQFVALRGVSNHADRFEDQASYSRQVLTAALRHAVNLLVGGD